MKSIFPKFSLGNFLIGLVAVGVVIVLIGVGLNVFSPKATVPSIAVVRRGDLSASVNATGKVSSKKIARLSLPLSGIVASIDKREGDDVNAGEVILSLRADESQRRVRQAELNLQSRQLDLTRAKAAPRDEDIEIARANLRKATLAAAAADDAYNKNATAQNETAREFARIDLEIVRASFNRLTNGLSQEELDQLQNAITNAQMDVDAAKMLWRKQN